MRIKKVIATSWEEAAELVKRRAEKFSQEGEAHLVIRLVEMDVETADGERVHDVYEGLIRYHAEDDLSGDELVQAMRESYSENEEHLKTYKTERGVKNYMKRSIEESFLDGMIVQ